MLSRYIYTALTVLSGILFAVYISQNMDKLIFSGGHIQNVINGTPAKRLVIKNNAGEVVANISLPTSDLFDRTGERQLNLHYLDKTEFQTLSLVLGGGQFFVGEEKLDGAVAHRLHENVWSIILPRKKLYILAPPHMNMAMRVLQFERKNRKDIFSCNGSAGFCRSVNITDFGGLTEVIDGTLKEDRFKGGEIIPRGRWAGPILRLSLKSSKTQEVGLRFTMKTPVANQTVSLLRLQQGEVTILQAGKRQVNPRFIVLNDLIFDVSVPLKMGRNRIEIGFGVVTEKNKIFPMKTAGIVTGLAIAPVH